MTDTQDRSLLCLRPSPLWVVLAPLPTWLLLLAAIAAGWWFQSRLDTWSPRAWPILLVILATLFAFNLILQIARWFATRYTLTATHVTAHSGVISRTFVEIPLHKVQSTIVLRRPLERLLGLGSIRIESAGASGIAVWWHALSQSHASAAAIRQAATLAAQTPRSGPSSSPPPIVIGLTGSIGAGKSTFASILSSLGAVVIDSDAQAKAALDTPNVRDSLVAWWGKSILNAQGLVDRTKIGQIVFSNPGERARLERLIHPLVRQNREGMIRQAAATGARFIVADVPLLFEAGVDAECDVTVCIDAPRPMRIERVARRGWDEGELSRREQAQWPIERKLALADERIDNSGDLDSLARAARDLLSRVAARPKAPKPLH